MAIPILIVKYPNYISEEDAKGLGTVLGRKLTDYHVLLLLNSTAEYDFKIFNGEYTKEEYVSIVTLVEDLQRDQLNSRVKKTRDKI